MAFQTDPKEFYNLLTQFALLLGVDIASLAIDIQQKVFCSEFKHFVYAVSCLLMVMLRRFLDNIVSSFYCLPGTRGCGCWGTLNKYIMQLKFFIAFYIWKLVVTAYDGSIISSSFTLQYYCLIYVPTMFSYLRGPWGALSPIPENNCMAVNNQVCYPLIFF